MSSGPSVETGENNMGKIAKVKNQYSYIYVFVERSDIEEFLGRYNNKTLTNIDKICEFLNFEEGDEVVLDSFVDESEFNFQESGGFDTDRNGQIVIFTEVYRWSYLKRG